MQGDTSPQGNPELYTSAVASLYRRYCALGPDPATGRWPPLVLNTHGWIRGLGLDVLGQVLRSVGLTHMLQVRAFALRPEQHRDRCTCV